MIRAETCSLYPESMNKIGMKTQEVSACVSLHYRVIRNNSSSQIQVFCFAGGCASEVDTMKSRGHTMHSGGPGCVNLDLDTVDFYSELRGKFFYFLICKTVMLVPFLLGIICQAVLEIIGQMQTTLHARLKSACILVNIMWETFGYKDGYGYLKRS